MLTGRDNNSRTATRAQRKNDRGEHYRFGAGAGDKNKILSQNGPLYCCKEVNHSSNVDKMADDPSKSRVLPLAIVGR